MFKKYLRGAKLFQRPVVLQMVGAEIPSKAEEASTHGIVKPGLLADKEGCLSNKKSKEASQRKYKTRVELPSTNLRPLSARSDMI